MNRLLLATCLALSAGCQCHRESPPEAEPTPIGAEESPASNDRVAAVDPDRLPIVASDWVRDTPPELAPVTLEGWEIESTDEAHRILRDGVEALALDPGELACAASERWLACVHSRPMGELRSLYSFALGAETGPIALRTQQSFFDDRAVAGPPRWTPDGSALWLHIGAHWERRVTPWPPAELPSAPEIEAGARALLDAMPEVERARFTRYEELHVPAIATAPMSAREAWRVQRAVTSTDRVAVAVRMSREPSAPELVRASLRRARELPADAAFAQIETALAAWYAGIAREYGDTGWFAARHRVEQVRDGDRFAMPAAEVSARNPPGYVQADDSVAQIPGLPSRVREWRVVVVRAADAPDLPIHLGFGGFNNCPDAAQHAAILRRWREQYGARLVAISRDSLELEVADPPHEPRDAVELAWRQLLYIGEGADLEEHAAVARSPRWFFWWD